MLTVYGIPNCNTVKKARVWLEQNNIEYTFYDYKKKGIRAEKIEDWFKEFSWDKFINKAGTTWKGLSDEEKAQVQNENAARNLMLEKNPVIRRPVVEDTSGRIIAIGFSEKEFEKLFF